MCFSAPASFTVAAITGLAGAAAISRTSARREIPLASVPLIFGTQQAIEGTLWLALGHENLSGWVTPLANAFIFSALVVWPVWAPVAAILVERNRIRFLAMAVLLALAVVLVIRGVFGMWVQPYGACVVQNSISYGNGWPYAPILFGAYVLCACCPFLLSSHKTLRLFGAIVLVGLIVSTTLYTYAYVSVWCFFGAVSSLTIYLHFARTPKEHAPALPR